MIDQTISHYKILEKLGEGGMGVVYKAQDLKLDRVVALKFLPHDLNAGEVNHARFIQEARAAATLNHPNICIVHAIEESSGERYIVMEFVEGPSLRKLIETGPVSSPEAIRIASHLAKGLSAAHNKGIVHRDIKPENILLTKEGIPKIADFGLAHRLELTRAAGSSLLSGTIAYMSPEQVQGEVVNHLTDIWSLGVVLYEMVTGSRPFSAKYTEALRYAIVHEKPPSLSAISDRVPESLQRLILRCLEKAPAFRFPDAAALADQLHQLREELKRPPGKPLRSIAVLPFADLSPKGDNKYFGDGLAEEVIASLSKLRDVSVVSRNAVLRFEKMQKTNKQIASELGVQYVLEGSVRKHGSHLRITTQLIDARHDIALWAETYSGTMDEVFDIQAKVAARVVRALKLRLTPGERRNLNRRATRNTEAYQLYLKGRFFWNRRNKDGLLKSIRYFEEAIEKDAKYALAWAGLADAYNLLREYGDVSQKDIYPKARAAAERALELDDRLAEAHTSLASLMMLNGWDWLGAEKEFKLAARLNPSYATTHHWYAEWLRYMGRIEESLREISLAIELDPLSPAMLRDKGMTLYYSGRYDEAIEYANKTLELEPHFASAHRLLSLAYQGKGMIAEAIAENQRWSELDDNRHEASIALAQLYAAGGRKAEAMRLLESLHPEKVSDGTLLRGIALVYTALGEKDLAFEWFEKSYAHRAVSLCSLRVDPKVDPLRSDPRYHSLLRRLGLED